MNLKTDLLQYKMGGELYTVQCTVLSREGSVELFSAPRVVYSNVYRIAPADCLRGHG